MTQGQRSSLLTCEQLWESVQLGGSLGSMVDVSIGRPHKAEAQHLHCSLSHQVGMGTDEAR